MMLTDMDESLMCIDLDYEHEMQQKHCSWIQGGQGHFMHRRWVLGHSNEEVLLQMDPNSPKSSAHACAHSREKFERQGMCA